MKFLVHILLVLSLGACKPSSESASTTDIGPMLIPPSKSVHSVPSTLKLGETGWIACICPSYAVGIDGSPPASKVNEDGTLQYIVEPFRFEMRVYRELPNGGNFGVFERHLPGAGLPEGLLDASIEDIVSFDSVNRTVKFKFADINYVYTVPPEKP